MTVVEVTATAFRRKTGELLRQLDNGEVDAFLVKKHGKPYVILKSILGDQPAPYVPVEGVDDEASGS